MTRLEHIKAGDTVSVDSLGEIYRVQQIVQAANGHEFELDSLTLKNINNNGTRVWSTGGLFPNLRKVQVSGAHRTASEYGNDEIRWPDGLQHY